MSILDRWLGRGTIGREPAAAGPVLGGVALGPRPWLVLGGGGLRGMAHLGAWRALEEAGFEPTGILGTSIGALVGACLAAGQPLEDLDARARELTRPDIARIQRRVYWVGGIRNEAVFHSDALETYLADLLPKGGWEEMAVRFQANAVELGSGRTEWFGAGARTDVSLADAVYASMALPVLYPPARLPGGCYVDGGVGDALPLTRAAELGATGIVAIDVGAGAEADARKVVSDGMVAIHQRVLSITTQRRRIETVEGWSGPPLLYIRPDLDGYGTFDFDHIPYFLEAGESATRGRLGLTDPDPGAPEPKVDAAATAAQTRG